MSQPDLIAQLYFAYLSRLSTQVVNDLCEFYINSKISIIPNSMENVKTESPSSHAYIVYQLQKRKHTKQIERNCHIPNLVQVLPYVEIYGLNLAL